MRKTTKLIEGGHRGLQACLGLCYYFFTSMVCVRYFTFFKIPKCDFLRFLPYIINKFSRTEPFWFTHLNVSLAVLFHWKLSGKQSGSQMLSHALIRTVMLLSNTPLQM